ncbi:MAG TPA: CatB-related O-acetyltransferase [Acidocella sp.]|jgi:acetyltransferase-like isoleucine patch superfamily enzyme|uniref:CatB-related O-acetyltransferase n=1 Tax=Acidocella sp. TaxID=50710 RepID=UPI002D0C5638|nr:CatB-related O-acetyltransferase [Acidocella sp.]HVE23404.1 CatB-related O-acetyltransferase [Acidocella sp.]
MLITAALRDKLQEHGVATEFGHDFHLPDQSSFEPPCSLKRMQAVFSLEMGAFSFARSGYYFGVKIGRYTSIDDDVQSGRGSHPVSWSTTSPLFYQGHRHVFNQPVEAAETFRTNAPPQKAKVTVIGNDVRIGYGALVAQGVTIGDGAIIQPCAVVTKDVPPYAIVAGNPGVITGMRFPPIIAARMQALAWWRYAFWDLSGAPVTEPEAFLDFVHRAADAGIAPHEPAAITLSTLT